MLPRSQRSIFDLGEEGSDAVHRGGADRGKMSTNSGARRHGNGGRGHGRDAGDAVVGLRIVVTHQHRHHARVVMKQMVLPRPAAARHRHVPCSSFLRACSRCRRELSPNKDVYMYRGDQGFCSQECRWQQILIDEARERDAMMKKERRGMSLHHHHRPRSTAAIGGVPRRLLAVA